MQAPTMYLRALMYYYKRAPVRTSVRASWGKSHLISAGPPPSERNRHHAILADATCSGPRLAENIGESGAG